MLLQIGRLDAHFCPSMLPFVSCEGQAYRIVSLSTGVGNELENGRRMLLLVKCAGSPAYVFEGEVCCDYGACVPGHVHVEPGRLFDASVGTKQRVNRRK